MFTSRQIFSTVWPSSASRRIRMISSVVGLFFFILGSELSSESRIHNGPVDGVQITMPVQLPCHDLACLLSYPCRRNGVNWE